jgi:hypothetical protein
MVRISRARLVKVAVGVLVVGGIAVGAVTVSNVARPMVYTLPAGNAEAGAATPIEGTDVSRVTLSPDAAKRIGVQTAAVGAMQVAGQPRLTVPYGAVLYDESGRTWAYVTTDHLNFVRKDITVESIAAQTVILSAGPPAGTEVVTVGATELYGTETEIGND